MCQLVHPPLGRVEVEEERYHQGEGEEGEHAEEGEEAAQQVAAQFLLEETHHVQVTSEGVIIQGPSISGSRLLPAKLGFRTFSIWNISYRTGEADP